VACVREIFHADRHLTIREVAEDVGIAFDTCQKILTEELQMRHVSVKSVSHFLTAEQKDDCMSVCIDLLERAQNDTNFMSSVSLVMKAGFTDMTCCIRRLGTDNAFQPGYAL